MSVIASAEMTDSDCGQVVFKDIRESYAADSDIVARFEFRDCEPLPDDYVAIKKIGWKDLNSCLVSVPASQAVDDSGRIKRIAFPPGLAFSGLVLPDELYQFCFISGSDLRGASSCFTIIRPRESDYTDMPPRSIEEEEANDEEGFVVLKSPQARFQDKMEQLQTELNVTRDAIEKLTAKNQSLEQKNCDLSRQKADVEQQMNALVQTCTDLEQMLQNLKQKYETRFEKELAEKLAIERQKRTAESDEMADQLRRMQQEYADEQAKWEIESRSQTQAARAELLRVRQELEAKLEAEVNSKQDMENTLDETCRRLLAQNNKLKEMEQVITNETKNKEEMVKAFQDVCDELTRVRANNAELRKQVEVLQIRLQEEEKLKIAKFRELDTANDLLKANHSVKQDLQDELETLRLSLSRANVAVEQQQILRREEQDKFKATESSLQRSVNELTMRLERAKIEYEETYKSKVKLESKLQRMREKVNNWTHHKTATPSAQTPQTSVDPAPLIRNESLQGAAAGDTNLESSSESHDASGPSVDPEIVVLPCGSCPEQVVCTVRDLTPYSNHMEQAHNQLVCPVCQQMFDKNIPGVDNYFQSHVEGHFDQRYPHTDP